MRSPTRRRKETLKEWTEDQEKVVTTNLFGQTLRLSLSNTCWKAACNHSAVIVFILSPRWRVGLGAFKKAMLNLSWKFQQIFFKANKIHFVQTSYRFSPHSTFISSHDSALNKTVWSWVALFCCEWQRAKESSPCCLCNTWWNSMEFKSQ